MRAYDNLWWYISGWKIRGNSDQIGFTLEFIIFEMNNGFRFCYGHEVIIEWEVNPVTRFIYGDKMLEVCYWEKICTIEALKF